MANWVSSIFFSISSTSYFSCWVVFPVGQRPPPPELIFLFLTTTSSVLLLLLLLLLRRKNRRMGSFKSSSGEDKQGKMHYNLPPGNQGFLPVVGETLRMISAYKSETPDSFIDERVAKYGRLFTSHLFGETTVFSADPDVNRHVLQNEGKLFESSYPSSISNLLGRYSLVLTKGSYHKQMHSLILSSFSNQFVLRDHLLPDIDRLIRLNTVQSWDDGQVVVLLDQAKKITFELAMKQLLSCEPGEWTEKLRREYIQVINGFFSIPFPFKLPFTTYGKAIIARTKVSNQIREVVRERLTSFSNSNTDGGDGTTTVSTGFRDFLEILLEKGVTQEDEVVDIVLSLLLAAYETTPTAMTLSVKFLTEHPAVFALLRDEHDKIKSRRKAAAKDSDEDVGGGPFDWNDYKNAMPFTNSVINETLRLSNIVSGVFRRSTEDLSLKGYNIRKGSRVFASFRAVHMSEDYFKDARTFNPWRWQQQQQQKTKSKNEQRQEGQEEQQQASNVPTSDNKSNKNEGMVNPYCVFGGGARLCPGYELARVELCVFLHHLVTSFSWDVAEEDKVIFFPTTRAIKGYPIRVRRRQNQN